MVESLLTHSTVDPELPSYEHRVLVAIREELERNHDCWDYLRDRTDVYLPREAQEPHDAYAARLSRTSYVSFFRDAITAFAGVLAGFELSDPPTSFSDAEDDIDLRGNSLTQFLMAADSLAMRDGGVLLCVDMPAGQLENNGEVVAQERRPYLAMAERSNVLNWRTRIEDGKEVLDWVICREWVEVPEGRFGMTWEPRYRLIGAANGQAFWQVFKIVDQGLNAQVEVVIVDEGDYLGPGGRPYEQPPVVWYTGGQQGGFGQGAIKLSALATLTLEHYRARSDHNELARKTCMPVPVRVGAVVGPQGKPAPLVIGPNSVVDLEGSGDFRFAEPSAASLGHLAENITHLEALIQSQTLAFMYGDGSGNKTATQSALEAAQTEATIKTISQTKASVVQQVIELWVGFTGEELSSDAGLIMQSQIFDRPLEHEDVRVLGEMEQNEQISRRSYLEQIIKGGILTVVASADEELERLEEEEPEEEELDAAEARNSPELTGEEEEFTVRRVPPKAEAEEEKKPKAKPAAKKPAAKAKAKGAE